MISSSVVGFPAPCQAMHLLGSFFMLVPKETNLKSYKHMPTLQTCAYVHMSPFHTKAQNQVMHSGAKC